jgi:hypothetical protein
MTPYAKAANMRNLPGSRSSQPRGRWYKGTKMRLPGSRVPVLRTTTNSATAADATTRILGRRDSTGDAKTIGRLEKAAAGRR